MTAKLEFANFDDIINRYQAGESVNKLARSLGVSRFALTNHLVKAGVAMRSQSDAERLKWQRMTDAQRAAQVADAHNVTRGRTVSRAEKRRSALGRQSAVSNSPVVETTLANMLRDTGLSVIQQRAIDIYNADVAVDTPPIAVELFGGGWHAHGRHLARFHQRTKYLLDSGWSVVIVWVDGLRHPFGIGCAQYIIALAQELSRDPSIRRQYRVILGDGQLAPPTKTYLNTPATIERLRDGDD